MEGAGKILHRLHRRVWICPMEFWLRQLLHLQKYRPIQRCIFKFSLIYNSVLEVTLPQRTLQIRQVPEDCHSPLTTKSTRWTSTTHGMWSKSSSIFVARCTFKIYSTRKALFLPWHEMPWTPEFFCSFWGIRSFYGQTFKSQSTVSFQKLGVWTKHPEY